MNRNLTDAADNRSLECATCGAVWITGWSKAVGGSSDGCLRCGGELLPIEVPTAEEPEIIP
jgi:hypothetical protein